ncbi:MAG: lipoyl synthase [Bacteroidales bacterium]|nr:lipoyl synthase [Bacteroidales bacterium]
MNIDTETLHLPRWMKAKLPMGENYSRIKNLIKEHKLNTICTSGNCPNKGECWSAGTATFMILGENCTRACKFCNVNYQKPKAVDWDEPARLAKTIKTLGLKHCVITSVSRDDLHDGGASFWASTIRAIKQENPGTTMEVLIPDFNRDNQGYDLIMEEGPEVISHNIETVRRLTPLVRSMARYERSLEVLRYISSKGFVTKSGLMLGLGETEEEVMEAMQDLRNVGTRVLTIGQYLSPSKQHAKVSEYAKPEVFERLGKLGHQMGFTFVESSPLVRSSYHAERHVSGKIV